jgi:hypothetical protein
MAETTAPHMNVPSMPSRLNDTDESGPTAGQSATFAEDKPRPYLRYRFCETKAKNLRKGELKKRGITYAQLAAKLADIGVQENERNLNNKIGRGGFTAAFLVQCLKAIGATVLLLEDA